MHPAGTAKGQVRQERGGNAGNNTSFHHSKNTEFLSAVALHVFFGMCTAQNVTCVHMCGCEPDESELRCGDLVNDSMRAATARVPS